MLSDAERSADAPALRALVAELRSPASSTREPVDPVRAARLLLGIELDPFLVQLVASAYANARTAVGDTPGYVYAFFDAAERDARTVKIGRTRKWLDERLGEWRTELGLDRRRRRALDGAHVYVNDDAAHRTVTTSAPRLRRLFGYPTAGVALAETVLHTLYYCERLRGRINRRTQRELIEYFYIDDLAALKLLTLAVTRHVTYTLRVAAAAAH